MHVSLGSLCVMQRDTKQLRPIIESDHPASSTTLGQCHCYVVTVTGASLMEQYINRTIFFLRPNFFFPLSCLLPPSSVFGPYFNICSRWVSCNLLVSDELFAVHQSDIRGRQIPCSSIIRLRILTSYFLFIDVYSNRYWLCHLPGRFPSSFMEQKVSLAGRDIIDYTTVICTWIHFHSPFPMQVEATYWVR